MHRSIPSAATEAPPTSLDIAHLARQTDGDRLLQRELLELFRLRSAALVDQMRARSAPPAQQGSPLRDLAHQLRGSALAIGAFGVAAAAETVERTFAPDPRGAKGNGQAALIALDGALTQALAAIDGHLRALPAA